MLRIIILNYERPENVKKIVFSLWKLFPKITVIYNTGHKTSTKTPVLHAGGVLGSIIEMILVNHPLKYLGAPGLVIIFRGLLFSFHTLTLFNETQSLPISFALISIAVLTLGVLLVLVSGILFAINRSVFHK